jgi:pyridoxal 5'-phosphate synthase pdxT subunit
LAKKVGVLALQGDFEAHEKAILLAGGDPMEVRTPEELARVDALVMPGGESTSMLRLLHVTEMFQPLKEFTRTHPIFATCAGAILLATEVKNPDQESLGTVDMTIERNAYGRQLQSRIVNLVPEPGSPLQGEVEAVFIRAPIIRRVGPGARTLLKYQNDPVLVDFGNYLIATYHPELSRDSSPGGVSVHRLFLSKL